MTTAPDSPIGRLADIVLVIPAPTPKVEAQAGAPPALASVQPMGSLFEQTLALTMDSLVMALMERTGETATRMFDRHAALE